LARLPQGVTAGRARVTGSSIHLELYGEISRLFFPHPEITDGCSSLGDGCTQHFPDALGQPAAIPSGKFAHVPFGVDPGPEQRFVGIDITHTDDDMTVHDELLYRHFAATAFFEEIGAVESIRQGFRSEPRQEPVSQGVVIGPECRAESARVVESERETVIKDDIQVIMLPGRGGGWHDAEAPGHPQVEDQGPAPAMDKKVLPAPVNAAYLMAGESACQFCRNRPTETGIPHQHTGDGFPFDIRRDRTTGSFHFR